MFEFVCKIRASSENNCPTVGKKCLISRKTAFGQSQNEEKVSQTIFVRLTISDEMERFQNYL